MNLKSTTPPVARRTRIQSHAQNAAEIMWQRAIYSLALRYAALARMAVSTASAPRVVPQADLLEWEHQTGVPLTFLFCRSIYPSWMFKDKWCILSILHDSYLLSSYKFSAIQHMPAKCMSKRWINAMLATAEHLSRRTRKVARVSVPECINS